MKIGQKLILSYSVLGFFLILIIFLSFLVLHHVERTFETVVGKSTPSLIALGGMMEYISDMMYIFHHYLAFSEEKTRESFEEEAAEWEEAMADYTKAEEGEEELISRMTQLFKEYREQGRYLMNLRDQGVSSEIILKEEAISFHSAYDRLEEMIKEEIEHDFQDLMQTTDKARQAIKLATVSITGLTAILFLILLFIAYFVGTTITKGTQELDAANQQLRASEQQLRAGNQQLRAASQALTEERASLEIKVKVRTVELSQISGQLRSLLESMKLGVIMVDLSYNVVFANSTAKFIFGKFPSEPITFKELQEKLKNINLSQALSYYVKDAKPFDIKEIAMEGKYYHIFLSPVRDLEEKIFLGALVILEDITEQKALEKMRSEIISITSHQLRTPLSVVKGNLEMVLGGDLGKITKGQKEILEEAFLGNERMIKLINDLMDVAKIDEGRFELKLEPIKLEDLVAEVVKEILPLAKEKHVSLSYTPPSVPLPKLKIDRQRVKQVFQNLIDNAIKYSRIDSRGRVTVEVQKDTQFLKVVIKDNGIGILQDEQDKMFERFFRGSNVTQLDPGGGTGLGLYIAKAIIEQSGGKIWFVSKEGRGTTFYITLPYKKT